MLDVTGLTYLSLRKALADSNALARYEQVDYNLDRRGLELAAVPFGDRLKVLMARASVWFRHVASSALATAVLDRSGLLHSEGGLFHSWKSPHGFTARAVLEDLAQRLRCCGQRGTYYYAHVLLPHYPYVYGPQCETKPARDWLINTVHEAHGLNTLATRAERQHLYADQVQCTQRILANVVTAIDANPALKDATIIVHGDHGARVAIPDVKDHAVEGYDAATYQRDMRATLVAVRVPGVPPAPATQPVRLDDVLQALRDSDYKAFDAAYAVHRTDAP